METPIVLVYIIAAIICIVNLILFWRLCKDTHTIVSYLAKKQKNTHCSDEDFENTDNANDSIGLKTPGKTDVQEFKRIVKQFCKSNKDPKSQKEFIDNLVAEYNGIFNEDFSQYLD